VQSYRSAATAPHPWPWLVPGTGRPDPLPINPPPFFLPLKGGGVEEGVIGERHSMSRVFEKKVFKWLNVG